MSLTVRGSSVNPGLDGRVSTLEANSLTLDETADSIIISGDLTAARTQAVFVAPFPSMLAQVSMSFAGAVAESDTNYWSVALVRYRGGAAATIGTKTTKTVASGGEGIAAFTGWNFDNVTFSATNNAFAKGDVLAVTFTPTGTPAALSNTCVTFRAPTSDNVPPPVTTLVSDAFTRADSASLGSAATGQAWTATTWTIASNAAVATATGTATLSAGVSDCTVQTKIVSHGSGSVGLVLRYTDANNYWGVTNTGVFKRVAGAVTNLATLTTGIVAGDSMRAVMSGNTITVYRQAGSAGGWSAVGTYVDTFNQTATQHGLRASGTSGSVDDFLVTVP